MRAVFWEVALIAHPIRASSPGKALTRCTRNLTRDQSNNDTAKDVKRRIQVFPELFAKLNALGGRWAARDVVMEHTLQAWFGGLCLNPSSSCRAAGHADAR